MNSIELLLIGFILGVLAAWVLNALLAHKAQVQADLQLLKADLKDFGAAIAKHDVELAKVAGVHALHDAKLTLLEGAGDVPAPAAPAPQVVVVPAAPASATAPSVPNTTTA